MTADTDRAALLMPTDDALLAAVRDGARTWQVADRLGLLCRRPYILRRLRRLEARGSVTRHPRYTAENDIYWVRALASGAPR